MGTKKTLLLILGLLIVWLLGNSLLRDNLGSSIRLFNDDSDWKNYFSDGAYFLKGQVPYKDTLSEYPQIPTYLFAVPYLLFRPSSGEAFNFRLYTSVFSFIMIGVLFGTISLLYNMLQTHKDRAFLLLLPAGLYFSYNRFDILPSFLVLLSLFLLQRKKNLLVGIILGIATLTKWYPALLLPIFLAYIYHTQRRIDWKMFLAFCLTCLVILAPTLLLGGMKAVLVPYTFHAERGFEYVSLPAILRIISHLWFRASLNTTLISYLFLVLSVLPVPFIILAHIDTFDKVIHWSVLVVAAFIIFSRIWSPQWILWVLPLLILMARTPADVAWIVTYTVVDYLAFPLLFDLIGPISWTLIVASLAVFTILLRFAIIAYRRSDGVQLQLLALPWAGKREKHGI